MENIDLISREDALAVVRYSKNAVDGIENLPSVDAVEVKHGEWMDGLCDDKHCTICSNCGSLIPTDTKIDYLKEEDNRFCYWCGAKMDGKKDAE